jgi:hypothetical protein
VQVTTSASPLRSLRRYLAVGLSLCVLVQIVFRLQVGSFRSPFAWPFLLGYSQKAMLDLIIYDAPWPLQAGMWLLVYALIGFLLWIGLSRALPSQAARWGVVFAAWAGAEVVLGLMAWALLRGGMVTME